MIFSGTDWQVAGDPNAHPKMAIRIVPDKPTLFKLYKRRHALRSKDIKEKIAAIKRRLAARKAERLAQEKEQAELAAAKEAAELAAQRERRAAKAAARAAGLNTVASDPKNSDESITSDTVVPMKPLIEEKVEVQVDPAVEYAEAAKKHKKKFRISVHSMKAKCQKLAIAHARRLEDNFQMEFGVEQCWFSSSVSLLPGNYYVYANCSFSKPEIELDEYVNELIKKYDSSDISAEDRATAAGNMLADEYANVMKSRPWKESLHSGSKDQYLPKIYMQVSSTNCLDLLSLSGANGHPIESVERVAIPVSTWPLMSESQSEAGSRGLALLISNLRKEALSLNITLKKLQRKMKHEK